MAAKLLCIDRETVFGLHDKIFSSSLIQDDPNNTKLLDLLAHHVQMTDANVCIENIPVHSDVHKGWIFVPVLIAQFGNIDEADSVLLTAHIDGNSKDTFSPGVLTALAKAIQTDVREENCRFHSHGKAIVFGCSPEDKRAAEAAWSLRHHEELARHCFLHIDLDAIAAATNHTFTSASPLTQTLLTQAQIACGVVPSSSSYCEPQQTFAALGIPSLLSGISKEKPGKKRALPEDPSLRLRTLDIVGDALCRALMEGSSCLHVLEQVHELRHLIAQHMKRLRQCASEIDDRYSPINKIAGAFLRSDSLQLLPIQSELLELLCEEKPERTKNVDLLHDLYRAYQWVYMNHDQSMGDFASDVEKISSATHKILHSSCGPDEVSALWDNWSQVVEKACAINAHISRVIRLLEPSKKERMYSLWNQ